MRNLYIRGHKITHFMVWMEGGRSVFRSKKMRTMVRLRSPFLRTILSEVEGLICGASFLGFLILSFSLTGCQAKSSGKFTTKSAFLMGAIVEVTADSPKAADIVFTQFRLLEDRLNHFKNTSEVGILNKTGQGYVSDELITLLERAREFSLASGGAFDITCAPLVDIWKKAIAEKKFPSKQRINKAKALVGWTNISFDRTKHFVKFMRQGMTIDLGGIAVGFALDSAIASLKEKGIKNALINAGGDIYCLGTKNGKPWQIGIAHPRQRGKIIQVVSLSDLAVATSADYEQYFEYKGRRYSHIIDPASGYPANAGVISVTVVAKDATTADALTTAIFVLGEEKGINLAKQFNAQVIKIINPVRKDGP